MIVDTSAIVAVLQDEDDAAALNELLGAYTSCISASTLVEARVVVNARTGASGLLRLDALLRRYGTDVAAFDREQADVAGDAYRLYGRGSGHPAKLNIGDTFSYALAAVRDEPLLYVGDDFSHTDIRSALEEYA
ncbi:MAG: type II toxin-antitoxin system VapC family toxin [Microbacterium sp.]|uniref:type II toxin-antitoxin system VapC family toxin n=1 Tax=Microbacterium sp. TaxID=51671 RepID=UPI003A8A8CB9